MTPPSLGTAAAASSRPNKALDKIWKAVAFKAMLNAPDRGESEGGREGPGGGGGLGVEWDGVGGWGVGT